MSTVPPPPPQQQQQQAAAHPAMNKTATPAPMANANANANAKPSTNQPRLPQTNPVTTLQPTDTYIPNFLTDLVPELKSYEQLVEAEKKLDIYLARKQIDIHQTVMQWNNSKNANGIYSHYDKNDIKYLRIFISNTAENQTWQIEQQHDKEEKAKLESTDETDTNLTEEKKIGDTNDNDNTPEASWTMRIEGRLIDDLPAEDPSRPKFNSFIKDIAVDFRKVNNGSNNTTSNNTDNEGDDDAMNGFNSFNLSLPGNNNNNNNQTNNGTNGQIVDVVEWHADDDNPVEFDGLDIRRNGSENLQCTITIQPRGFTGNSLEYSKELSMIIGKSRGSLHEAVYSLYKYLLINNLLINSATSQNKNGSPIGDNDNDNNKNGEKTIVQIDKFLSILLPNGNEKKDKDGDINMDDVDDDEEDSEGKSKENEIKQTMKLSEFLPLVNSHIKPMKPIVVDYTVRVDKASTYGELVFDVEVPDLSTLQKKPRIDEIGQDGLNLVSELETFSKNHKNQLDTYEKEISLLHLQLNETANKYQFFHKLGENPVPALEDYIASQANALKILSGDEGFNEDTVRRADFYQDNENMLFENIGVMLANGRI